MPTSLRATLRRAYAVVPYWDKDNPEAFEEWLRDLASAINGIYDGASNAVGSVTLTDSSTTTTLTDVKIGAETVVLLTPTTADAKTEGTPWVSGKTDGSCTLNHTSDTTSRIYDYNLQG